MLGRPVLRAEEALIADIELKVLISSFDWRSLRSFTLCGVFLLVLLWKDVMFGHEAAKARAMLELSWPVENGKMIVSFPTFSIFKFS